VMRFLMRSCFGNGLYPLRAVIDSPRVAGAVTCVTREPPTALD
jgi:hypothetical protein